MGKLVGLGLPVAVMGIGVMLFDLLFDRWTPFFTAGVKIAAVGLFICLCGMALEVARDK